MAISSVPFNCDFSAEWVPGAEHDVAHPRLAVTVPHLDMVGVFFFFSAEPGSRPFIEPRTSEAHELVPLSLAPARHLPARPDFSVHIRTMIATIVTTTMKRGCGESSDIGFAGDYPLDQPRYSTAGRSLIATIVFCDSSRPWGVRRQPRNVPDQWRSSRPARCFSPTMGS